MKDIRADILIFGTGNFAGRIALDLAATATEPVDGRDRRPQRGPSQVAAHRRQCARRDVRPPGALFSHEVDLSVADAAADAIAAAEPQVIVQAASFQTGAVISHQGNAWTRLVAEGGLSATAVLQAPLSISVARAIKAMRPQAHFINCCFADVVNPLIAALDLPITCGVGNVAILANAFAGALALGPDGSRCWRTIRTLRPGGAGRTRDGPSARVWIDGEEIADVYRRFADVQLTREPAIEISGASGVPLMLAMAQAGLERACARTARPARRLSGQA